MTRESALLGTPTYTVFLGELAAVDAELIRLGRIVDLRASGSPIVTRKLASKADVGEEAAGRLMDAVLRGLASALPGGHR